jgi:hypothetical protein
MHNLLPSYFFTHTCGIESHWSPIRGAALPVSTTAAVFSHCDWVSAPSSTETNPRGTLALPRQKPRTGVSVEIISWFAQTASVLLIAKFLRKSDQLV